MDVKDCMSGNVTSVDAEAMIEEAAGLMQRKNLSWLPVVDKGHVVGTVHGANIPKRDDAEAAELQQKTRDVMEPTRPPHCRADEPVFSAAVKMRKKRIGQLLVLDADDRPVGTVTREDLGVSAPKVKKKTKTRDPEKERRKRPEQRNASTAKP
jgi:CBS domain-containing protein